MIIKMISNKGESGVGQEIWDSDRDQKCRFLNCKIVRIPSVHSTFSFSCLFQTQATYKETRWVCFTLFCVLISAPWCPVFMILKCNGLWLSHMSIWHFEVIIHVFEWVNDLQRFPHIQTDIRTLKKKWRLLKMVSATRETDLCCVGHVHDLGVFCCHIFYMWLFKLRASPLIGVSLKKNGIINNN